MAGFQQSFAHFLRTGHFISENTPVTASQLNVIKAYLQINPTLLDAIPPHQSITRVETPTNGKISEEDCPHCRKNTEIQLKEAEKELEEKFKACEEKLDKLYQSSAERLLLFMPQASSSATTSEAETTENKEDGKSLRCT